MWVPRVGTCRALSEYGIGTGGTGPPPPSTIAFVHILRGCSGRQLGHLLDQHEQLLALLPAMRPPGVQVSIHFAHAPRPALHRGERTRWRRRAQGGLQRGACAQPAGVDAVPRACRRDEVCDARAHPGRERRAAPAHRRRPAAAAQAGGAAGLERLPQAVLLRGGGRSRDP
eukprot:81639-Prymnesium_polylepis.1